jgi:hypothetical protein
MVKAKEKRIKVVTVDVDVNVGDVLNELDFYEQEQLYLELKESYAEEEVNFETIGNLSESEVVRIAMGLNVDQANDLKRILKEFYEIGE